jgi:hypothetical protein
LDARAFPPLLAPSIPNATPIGFFSGFGSASEPLGGATPAAIAGETIGWAYTVLWQRLGSFADRLKEYLMSGRVEVAWPLPGASVCSSRDYNG